MPTYEVRNRKSKMVVAEVDVERPEDVISAVLEKTGSAIEDLALSLGNNMEEVRAALDIVEKPHAGAPNLKGASSRRLTKAMPATRRNFYVDREAC